MEKHLLDPIAPDFDFRNVFAEVFVLVREEEGLTGTVGEDTWYCTDCMDKLVLKYLWKWVLGRRKIGTHTQAHWYPVDAGHMLTAFPIFVEDDDYPDRDCPYGYDCAMVLDERHACMYNVCPALEKLLDLVECSRVPSSISVYQLLHTSDGEAQNGHRFGRMRVPFSKIWIGNGTLQVSGGTKLEGSDCNMSS